ncbi:6-O-methylguanine DNA methyltransferase [Paucibacter aquatile]|uniref:methylated-DNA--[protein]-cysteine S-methyltransferase n=1 Tax=Kinneretia aquatilis TaxID=2070761 RepID=A0A2N8L007_9BURK|nr:methylated-DNA--[protein]-cysteine S-methyltransferase [Paucibacter aquatile]PND39040.1 6-O-methylguanine DNA methyltransferase [Paucibacter aquatile]
MNRPHYDRVRQALEQLSQGPVPLQTLAEAAGMSLFHFQRRFVELAGVTPKEFEQALALERAKASLRAAEPVLDAALAAGLSGPSRLHDLFLSVDGMTPGQFKQAGQGLQMQWSVVDSLLGPVWLAASARGLHQLSFLQDESPEALAEAAAQQLPQAVWQRDDSALRPLAEELQRRLSGLQPSQPIGLALSGTPLRLKVWQALLQIPEGQVLSYTQLARLAGAPQAVRAVASCVAANPIACLIPCHRVIRANAEFGEYRWGPQRKRALLGLELARADARATAAAASALA